jgi:hypothetical protein
VKIKKSALGLLIFRLALARVGLSALWCGGRMGIIFYLVPVIDGQEQREHAPEE